MNTFKIYIITGLSGSGKSTVLAAFEDADYYCVDNMPVALLPNFPEIALEGASEFRGLAFVMDLREKGFLSGYRTAFDAVRKKGYPTEILFLEAEEAVLLQRYSQTRRQHPLAHERTLPAAIRLEKSQLQGLRSIADRVIDTSRLNVHELKSLTFRIAEKRAGGDAMRINVMSFGYKYGLPPDADLIMDVRFLANPYFVPALKPLDGETDEVMRFVMATPEAIGFLERYLTLLDYLIPLYEKEGKAYLTIAIGCTGGRHRSVAIARAIFKHLAGPDRRLDITHRDIGRPV